MDFSCDLGGTFRDKFFTQIFGMGKNRVCSALVNIGDIYIAQNTAFWKISPDRIAHPYQAPL